VTGSQKATVPLLRSHIRKFFPELGQNLPSCEFLPIMLILPTLNNYILSAPCHLSGVSGAIMYSIMSLFTGS
jgi:hypothetical protein